MTRRRLAAFAFAVLSAAARADEPQHGDEAIGALWTQTFAQGDYDKIVRTYGDAALAFGEGSGVDPALCKKHKARIDAAAQTNPVGIGVWRVAWRCAEADGEAGLAAQRRRRFEALVRHAFESVPPDAGRTPIRVLDEGDVAAVIAESGLDAIDLYYDTGRNWRYLELVVTLLDKEAGIERRLVFDVLDARMRLKRDRADAKFPTGRNDLAEALLKHGHESGSIAATRLLQTRQMLNARGTKFDMPIDVAVRDNNKVAIYTFAAMCTTSRENLECGTRHVDALLPYAEGRFSPALVWLAQAYRSGIGVPRDDNAARVLLDAADRRAGGVTGRLLLAQVLRRRGGETFELPAVLRGPIEAAARRGDLAAQLALVDAANTPAQTARWSALQRDAAKRAAEAGSAAGQYAWSLRLSAERRDDEAAGWLRRAAANDETRAQAALAQHYLRGEPNADDLKRAVHWYARAAHGGDRAAMLWLGRQALAQPDYADAKGWFESGASSGNADAKVELATLLLYGKGSIPRDHQRAAALLRDVVDDPARTQARVDLAELLRFGVDVEHDAAEAERLLRLPTTPRDDAGVQFALASLLIDDPTTPERQAEGIALLRRAATANDRAKIRLGARLWNGRGVERDRAAAEKLWLPLVEKGNLYAINEYAWALCASDDDAIVDGRKGLAVFKKNPADGPLPPAFQDTLAACQAAAGDYDDAVQTQIHALETMKASFPGEKATIAAFDARVALYKSRQRYREKPKAP